MKRKIVLWGTNEKEEKILVALHLLDKEGKVNLYTFNENMATEDFYNRMLNQWRENVEIEFPEGYTLIERPLTITDGILPEEIKVDRPDIITRAQTEWHFVVLSSKLYEMYKSELEDLSETIENLKEYDNKIWNEMRAFWSKVQEQVIEKNLFRDHAQSLKNKTNRLFDHLKALKKKVEEEYEANSAKHKEAFINELKDIEEKIEKGLGLKPIFEELKSLQNKLRGVKFTKNDRNSVWERLDKAFKVVKEKRFGDKGQSTSNVGRHQRRYDGLLNAISKMEKSIARDKDDQKFQDRKIATTDGQLEMQIRQAKIKMIEERIKSKELKLEDMYKTKKELEARIEKEKQKEEKRAKMEEAKAAAEAKIADEMKKSSVIDATEAKKLEEAAAKIKEAKKKDERSKAETPAVEAQEVASAMDENTAEEGAEAKEGTEKKSSEEEEKKESGDETLLGAIAATVGEALGGVGEAFEDVVDTVKAVAEVVEDKIEDATSGMDSNDDLKEEPKNNTTSEDQNEEDGSFLGNLKTVISETMEKVEDAVEDIVDQAKSVAKAVEDKVEDAMNEVKGDEEE